MVEIYFLIYLLVVVLGVGILFGLAFSDIIEIENYHIPAILLWIVTLPILIFMGLTILIVKLINKIQEII